MQWPNAKKVRKDIIENLDEQNAVQKVLSVFVDSRCRTFYDRDNKLLQT